MSDTHVTSIDKGFKSLPLDMQRQIIDECIKHNKDTIIFGGERHVLPHIIQITYRCNNTDCNEILTARFFTKTVISGSIARSRKCPKCRYIKLKKGKKRKIGTMYISHKTAEIDAYLGVRKKQEETGGLYKFFKHLDNIIQEDKEQYGPPPESD